eukprot:1054489-Amphidinium_carterae.1
MRALVWEANIFHILWPLALHKRDTLNAISSWCPTCYNIIRNMLFGRVPSPVCLHIAQGWVSGIGAFGGFAIPPVRICLYLQPQPYP